MYKGAHKCTRFPKCKWKNKECTQTSESEKMEMKIRRD